MDLEQRLLLEAPVEERHQAAVARDHVETVPLEREIDDRCFAEVDL